MRSSGTQVSAAGDVMTGQLGITKNGDFSSDVTASALHVAGELPVITLNRPTFTYTKMGINSSNNFSIGGGAWPVDQMVLTSNGDMTVARSIGCGGTMNSVNGYVTGAAFDLALEENAFYRQVRFTADSVWALKWTISNGSFTFTGSAGSLLAVNNLGQLFIHGEGLKPGGGLWATVRMPALRL